MSSNKKTRFVIFRSVYELPTPTASRAMRISSSGFDILMNSLCLVSSLRLTNKQRCLSSPVKDTERRQTLAGEAEDVTRAVGV